MIDIPTTTEKVRQAAEAVAPLYRLNEWRWGYNTTQAPTVDEIEDKIFELKGECENEVMLDPNTAHFVATGRLRVSYFPLTKTYTIHLDLGSFE